MGGEVLSQDRLPHTHTHKMHLWMFKPRELLWLGFSFFFTYLLSHLLLTQSPKLTKKQTRAYLGAHCGVASQRSATLKLKVDPDKVASLFL